MKKNKKDLTGLKKGRLTVLYKTNKRECFSVVYVCRCDCGNIFYKSSKNIMKSQCLNGCGCFSPLKKYPDEDKRLYEVWRKIKSRCNDKNNTKYGGRGINICEDWKNDFFKFRNWAYDNGYDKNAEYMKCTIDRINNNGNYEPNNCRWVSMSEQSRNTRANKLITIDGETKCITDWLNLYHKGKKQFYWRIKHGWDEIEAIKTPIRHKSKNNVKEID